jgi:large subunit ribosomal protein L18
MPGSGPTYRVQFRRKREGKTDYRHRLKLLKSRKPRLVVRISSRHVRAQISRASPVGDDTMVSANSKQLEKYGWKGGTCNLPCAYLVGFLCGRQAVKANTGGCILDIGIHEPVKGSRVFAVLKGAVDAGLEIPHEEGILPAEDRASGAHIARYAAQLKEESPDAYKNRFSSQLGRGLPPEELQEHFKAVKQKILDELGG